MVLPTREPALPAADRAAHARAAQLTPVLPCRECGIVMQNVPRKRRYCSTGCKSRAARRVLRHRLEIAEAALAAMRDAAGRRPSGRGGAQ